jgi:hypothetical protein
MLCDHKPQAPTLLCSALLSHNHPSSSLPDTSAVLTPSRLVPAFAALRHGPNLHTCTHKPHTLTLSPSSPTLSHTCNVLTLSHLVPAFAALRHGPHMHTCTHKPPTATLSPSSPTLSHFSVVLTLSHLVPACAALRHGPNLHASAHKPQQRCRQLRSPLGLGEGRQLRVPSSSSRHFAACLLLRNNLAVSPHMLGSTHTSDQRLRRPGSVVGLAEWRKLRVPACAAAARRCACAFGGMGCCANVYVCAHAAEQCAGYQGEAVGMAEQPELCLQGLER